MSWRDRQGPASFRGVPFFVDTAERSGGRSAVVHDIPFSESDPYVEDLGRKGTRRPVEGYVLGADYLTARDRLLDALEDPGPGLLVHPALGSLTVVVESYRQTESRAEGGIARFSIVFLATIPAPVSPTSTADAPARVVSSSTAVRAAATAQFSSTFVKLLAFQSSAVGAIRSAANAIGALLDAKAVAAELVNGLRQSVAALVSNATALVNTPANAIAATIDLVRDVATAVSASPGIIDPSGAILSLYAASLGLRPPSTTPDRTQEQANFDAFTNAWKRAVLLEAAVVLVNQTFETYDAALVARNRLVDLIDAHCDEVSDDTYPLLRELRASVSAAVPADDLPRLTTHTPPFDVPSLVLAHQLYGSVALEGDLVRRNAVKNPCAVPGGVELEVLARD